MIREQILLWRPKSIFILFILLAVSILLTNSVSAHPGNTAADGCHYCRTNCDKWGVARDERHCHGDSNPPSAPVTTVEIPPPPPQMILPTSTSTPVPTATQTPTETPTQTSTPTIEPTSIPTQAIVPTNTDTPVPTSTPEVGVLGARTENPFRFVVGMITMGVIGWRAVTQKWPFHPRKVVSEV